MVRSRAIRTCKTRQDRKVAAVRSHSYVPRINLVGANPVVRAGSAFRDRVHDLLWKIHKVESDVVPCTGEKMASENLL